MQTKQAVTCKYPGCENEPRAADDGAGAKPKYCGRPDPLTGKPHTALTAFRRRQELTRQSGDGRGGGPGTAGHHGHRAGR